MDTPSRKAPQAGSLVLQAHTHQEEDDVPPAVRFFLAMPFLVSAVLLSIPSTLCMYAARLIEGDG